MEAQSYRGPAKAADKTMVEKISEGFEEGQQRGGSKPAAQADSAAQLQHCSLQAAACHRCRFFC